MSCGAECNEPEPLNSANIEEGHIEIRSYEPRDENQVREVFDEGQRLVDPERRFIQHHVAVDNALKGDLAQLSEMYVNNEDNHMWVAVDGPKVTGFVAFFRRKNGEAELCRLQVRPECRRRGIGSRLLQTFEEFAFQNGYKTIETDTMSIHPTCVCFIKKHGYRLKAEQVIEDGLIKYYFDKNLSGENPAEAQAK